MVWNRDCIFDRRSKVGHAFLLPIFVLVDFFCKHTRYWLGSVSRLPPSILVLAMPKGRNSVDGHSFEET